MERNAVERNALLVLLFLDVDTVRVVRAGFVQRQNVRSDQADQYQREGDHVEGEEAVQGRIANDEVAADQDRQIVTDHRNGTEQVHDDLSAPVRHLPPREQVTEEGFTHQHQEDADAEQPGQLTRLAVRTVDQATEHVQIDHDEEGRGTGRVHVADQPATRDVAHDVFDRSEGDRHTGGVQRSIRLVVHDQEDAGDDLDNQNKQGQRAEEIPEVEVLRCVVFGQVRLVGGGEREAVVDPAHQFLHRAHLSTPLWVLIAPESSPTNSVSSLRY